jgi:hypothetical protein
MRRIRPACPIAFGLLLCWIVLISSCRRLKVGAELEDIEWVVIACHTEGFRKQWVAKLTPESDGRLIARLVAAINGARRIRETSATGGDGFIVFKLKRDGVRSFNFVPWDYGREVEIRPAYSSGALGALLEEVANQRIGWKTGDSLPGLKIKEIQVRQAGTPMRVFRPGSRSFDRLLDGASEVLKAFDPRWCMPNYDQGNVVDSSGYQKSPQFVFLLEKPTPMYKLVVEWKGGYAVVTARVRYVTFSSSVIAVYRSYLASGALSDVYIAFVPDGALNRSYSWSFSDAYWPPETMGKPDGFTAYNKLLDAYNQLATPEQ